MRTRFLALALICGCQKAPPPGAPIDATPIYQALEKIPKLMPTEVAAPDCRKYQGKGLIVLGHDLFRRLLGDSTPGLEGRLYPTGLDDFRVSALRPRGEANHQEDAAQAMANFSRATHVAIYHVDEVSSPSVVGGTFSPGSVKATVSVFAKESGKLDCASQVTAANSKQTSYMEKQQPGYLAESANARSAAYSVEEDLRKNFAKGVRAALGYEY